MVVCASFDFLVASSLSWTWTADVGTGKKVPLGPGELHIVWIDEDAAIYSRIEVLRHVEDATNTTFQRLSKPLGVVMLILNSNLEEVFPKAISDGGRISSAHCSEAQPLLRFL